VTDIFIPLAKRCYWRLRACTLLCAEDIAASLRDHREDRRFGIDTSFDNIPVAQGTYKDAENYEPTRYAALKFVIDYLQLDSNDVFVDYGCGKARVLCLVARHKLKKVIGIEFDERAASIGMANLASLQGKNTETEIVIGDAIHFDPSAGTVFFLFNPFGVKTFEKVLQKIRQSLVEHPREIRIAYLNDRCKSLMESQDWLKLETTFNNINPAASIWRNT
jgi:precorrin-6B methylase 2